MTTQRPAWQDAYALLFGSPGQASHGEGRVGGANALRLGSRLFKPAKRLRKCVQLTEVVKYDATSTRPVTTSKAPRSCRKRFQRARLARYGPIKPAP